MRGLVPNIPSTPKVEIYVDCAQVATLHPSRSKLISYLEYDFLCGDETLRLVLHGRDIDIVHRGMLVGNRHEYKPQEKLPLVISIILMILTMFLLYFSLKQTLHVFLWRISAVAGIAGLFCLNGSTDSDKSHVFRNVTGIRVNCDDIFLIVSDNLYDFNVGKNAL